MTPAAVAALCSLGVMLLCAGAYRLNHRVATARRVAEVLGEQPGVQYSVPLPRAPRDLMIDIRQLVAQLEPHDATLRPPAVAFACVAGLIGLATISPVWPGDLARV